MRCLLYWCRRRLACCLATQWPALLTNGNEYKFIRFMRQWASLVAATVRLSASTVYNHHQRMNTRSLDDNDDTVWPASAPASCIFHLIRCCWRLCVCPRVWLEPPVLPVCLHEGIPRDRREDGDWFIGMCDVSGRKVVIGSRQQSVLFSPRIFVFWCRVY